MLNKFDKKVMKKLKYADLEGLLKEFGKKGMGRIMYRAMLETHKIYGSEYVVEICRELAADPQGHKLPFPSSLGKRYFIKYLRRAYIFTKDENYYKAVEYYRNDRDPDVSRFAKSVIEKLNCNIWKQKYDDLKLRTTGYILGICQAIKEISGDEVLKKIIDQAARNSAHNVKAERLERFINKTEALGKELETLLTEFNTSNIMITQNLEKYRIDNPDCGCLLPFMQLAGKYGFSKTEARHYACRRCMPSYNEAAAQLNLGFNGKLTENGCFMEFLR